jgi:hypothetical protein
VATSSLTTVANLDTYLGSNAYSSGQKTAAVNAANDAIEKYCGYTIAATNHSQWLDSAGGRYVFLDHIPLIYVRRMALSSQSVISISNTSSDAELATVAITPETLEASTSPTMVLTVVGGTNAGTETLTLTSYSTMAALETAIEALGKGWAVTVNEEEQPKALRPLATTALNSTSAQVDLYAPFDADTCTVDDPGQATLSRACGWPTGNARVYVDYRAGYETIPSALTEIANAVASDMLSRAKRDPQLQSEKLGEYSWTAKASVSSTIQPYKGELQRFRKVSVL